VRRGRPRLTDEIALIKCKSGATAEDRRPGRDAKSVPPLAFGSRGTNVGVRRWHGLCSVHHGKGGEAMSILYIIGAIVVIIVVLRVLGLF
jgi:hypothetical protein